LFAYKPVCVSPNATLRVFVVGKNYRLQNIQLSKIKPGGFAPQTHNESIFAALKPRNRLRPRLVGAPQEAARSRRNRQQPSDGRRRAGDQTASQHLTDNFSKIRRKLFAVAQCAVSRCLLRSAFALEASADNRQELACQPKLVAIQRATVGGEYRSRTGDLLVANQALSQLS
jgi:hypothetical protein